MTRIIKSIIKSNYCILTPRLVVADLDLSRLRKGSVPYAPHAFMREFYEVGMTMMMIFFTL